MHRLPKFSLSKRLSVTAAGWIYVMSLLCAHPVYAQKRVMTDSQIGDAIQGLETSYPKGSIDSMTMVANVIEVVVGIKADVQLWYQQSERDCYDRFFVTACLNKLRVTHVHYNDTVQRVLVEAKAFQRKHHIEELDESLKLKLDKKSAEDKTKK
jgi:hypothetical protein